MSQLAAEDSPSVPRSFIWRGAESSSFSSPEHTFQPFDRAVLSWNCTGAARFELDVRGQRYLMGSWSEQPRSSKTERVQVDVLTLSASATTLRFHVVAEPGTVVKLVAVTTWLNSESGKYSADRSSAWGHILNVPPRSQNIELQDPGSICSPTSLAMVLEFHGIKKTTRDVANAVFDHAEKIYGNWPFNTAAAFRLGGLEACVISAGSFEELEHEIAAGQPVVTGLRWKRGELSGSSIQETSGHLIAVVGFTADGDVVVNDPASAPEAVRRVYKRREFFKAWQEEAHGIMYVVKGN